MSVYLAHHRAFCEHLGSLHSLEVSWDGEGSVPLRRKPLQAAMEMFGRRPDLTIGSKIKLDRGGIEVSMFRSGRDVQVSICKAGTVLISGHRPRQRSDFMISEKTVTESLLRKVAEVIPADISVPVLSAKTKMDVFLERPFEGFVTLRLEKGQHLSSSQLLIGRDCLVPNVYAYHDAIDLPDDIYQDQPLTGQSCLRDLVNAYILERSTCYSPA